MSRRLGIHATFLNPGRSGGAETYTRQLLHHLLELDLGDLHLTLFVGKDSQLSLKRPNLTIVPCDIDPRQPRRRILWDQLALPGILRRHKLDLVHFPYASKPLSYRGPSLVTLHDTLRLQWPDAIGYVERTYKRIMEQHLASSDAQLICVSQADAAVFEKHYPAAAGRITVIHHGVDERFLESPQEQRPAGDDLLWVGRPYPAKDVPTLLRALALLKARSLTPKLRIVGGSPADHAPLQALAHELGIASQLSLEPARPHAELAGVYRSARLLCYPSRVESFGMPVLEALASRLPVLCSDIPAFREIAGDAAAYAPAGDPAAWATALEKLLADDAERTRLSAAGQERARLFPWRAAAEITLALYQSLLK